LATNPDSDKKHAVNALLTELDTYKTTEPTTTNATPSIGLERVPDNETTRNAVDKTHPVVKDDPAVKSDPDGAPPQDTRHDGLTKQLDDDATFEPNRETSYPVYKRWWFWTTIGVVAAGAAAAGGYYLYRQQTGPANYDHVWPIP